MQPSMFQPSPSMGPTGNVIRVAIRGINLQRPLTSYNQAYLVRGVLAFGTSFSHVALKPGVMVAGGTIRDMRLGAVDTGTSHLHRLGC